MIGYRNFGGGFGPITPSGGGDAFDQFTKDAMRSVMERPAPGLFRDWRRKQNCTVFG